MLQMRKINNYWCQYIHPIAYLAKSAFPHECSEYTLFPKLSIHTHLSSTNCICV